MRSLLQLLNLENRELALFIIHAIVDTIVADATRMRLLRAYHHYRQARTWLLNSSPWT